MAEDKSNDITRQSCASKPSRTKRVYDFFRRLFSVDARIAQHIAKMGDSDYRWRAIEALVKTGERAVPALGDALKDEDARVRGIAAHVLGKIAEKNPENAEIAKVAPALVNALKDESAFVRRNVNAALVKIGKPAIPALIEAYKNDEKIWVPAGNILVKLGKSAVPSLVRLSKSVNREEKKRGIMALVMMGRPGFPAIVDALGSDDPELQRLAGRGLRIKIRDIDETELREMGMLLKKELEKTEVKQRYCLLLLENINNRIKDMPELGEKKLKPPKRAKKKENPERRIRGTVQ